MQENTDRITLFGAGWCSDCRRSKAHLDREGIDYDYVDIEAVDGGPERAEQISGRKSIPVIVFPDGAFLVDPSDQDLAAKLA